MEPGSYESQWDDECIRRRKFLDILQKMINHRIQEESHGECDCENQHTFSFFEFMLKEFRKRFGDNKQNTIPDDGPERIHKNIVYIRQAVAEKLRNFNKSSKAQCGNDGIFK